jgi:hypothetical protein
MKRLILAGLVTTGLVVLAASKREALVKAESSNMPFVVSGADKPHRNLPPWIQTADTDSLKAYGIAPTAANLKRFGFTN